MMIPKTSKQPKPKLCQRTKGCGNLRMKQPGNSTLYFKGCIDCEIEANLSKHRQEVAQDKTELEKVRQIKKNTPQEKFYQLTAWKNCSKAVLLHYADDDLMVVCSTSGRAYEVNSADLHCGHYYKSNEHKATAFEFKNLAPQSASDNTKKGGLPEVMAEWIERTHGPGTLEWLDRKKNETLHLDKITLEQISKFYLNMLNEELKRRNIKNPWK